ncbi:MAG: hypothetical protein ACAH59_00265 [Pseudobdellovibrionaceae bacterium]
MKTMVLSLILSTIQAQAKSLDVICDYSNQPIESNRFAAQGILEADEAGRVKGYLTIVGIKISDEVISSSFVSVKGKTESLGQVVYMGSNEAAMKLVFGGPLASSRLLVDGEEFLSTCRY